MKNTETGMCLLFNFYYVVPHCTGILRLILLSDQKKGDVSAGSQLLYSRYVL